MNKLDINSLTIEITRQCNIECIHCLRGESENKDISLETLNNLFNNISTINILTLTGGEPLLKPDIIDKIVDLIETKQIKVNHILLITNGTIINKKILESLKKLIKLTHLELSISSDKFHIQELENKNLLEKRNKNLSTFKELFNAHEYGDIDENTRLIFIRQGRAKKISNDDIKLLNNKGKKTNYIFSDAISIFEKREKHYDIPYIENNRVLGKIGIDINGNIVDTDLSFIEEDEQSNPDKNINFETLENAINNNLIEKLNNKYFEEPMWQEFYKIKQKSM